MQQRVNATINDETLAKDGGLAPAVRTAIDNARSRFQLRFEQWKSESGSTISEPTSTTRGPQECSHALKQSIQRSE